MSISRHGTKQLPKKSIPVYFQSSNAINRSVLLSNLMNCSIPSSDNISTWKTTTPENLIEDSGSSSYLMKDSSPSYDLMSDSVPPSNHMKTWNQTTTENLTESFVSSSDLMRYSSPFYDPMNDSFYLQI